MNYPQDLMDKIIQGDCLKIMKEIPDNSIDLIVTDPPYNVSSDTKIARNGGNLVRIRPLWD